MYLGFNVINLFIYVFARDLECKLGLHVNNLSSLSFTSCRP